MSLVACDAAAKPVRGTNELRWVDSGVLEGVPRCRVDQPVSLISRPLDCLTVFDKEMQARPGQSSPPPHALIPRLIHHLGTATKMPPCRLGTVILRLVYMLDSSGGSGGGLKA